LNLPVKGVYKENNLKFMSADKDKILETVLAELKYIPLKDVIVKPLNPIMIEREVTTMQPTDVKDEAGNIQYDTVTEVKEVESDWMEAVVLAVPKFGTTAEVGDIVVFARRNGKEFDLYRTSMLVDPFYIVAIKK
jgi:hypothetical protein